MKKTCNSFRIAGLFLLKILIRIFMIFRWHYAYWMEKKVCY